MSGSFGFEIAEGSSGQRKQNLKYKNKHFQIICWLVRLILSLQYGRPHHWRAHSVYLSVMTAWMTNTLNPTIWERQVVGAHSDCMVSDHGSLRLSSLSLTVLATRMVSISTPDHCPPTIRRLCWCQIAQSEHSSILYTLLRLSGRFSRARSTGWDGSS